MAETIDEITITYEDEGIVTTKELDKAILTRGAWTTIVFKFQDWDRKNEEYGPIKFSIRRYRKLKGEFKQQSKFNISNAQQAEKIIETLSNWLK
jgi:hypothetical protein